MKLHFSDKRQKNALLAGAVAASFLVMKRVFRTLKAIFFWSYGRSTWQWDVLCVLILAFIFLTPKSWFQSSELSPFQTHQNGFALVRVLVDAQTLSAQPDRGEIQERVRALTGRADAEVIDWRPAQVVQGKTVAYEVDIR